MIMESYNDICEYLLSLIPKEEIESLEGSIGEFCPQFMGFVDTYYYLSNIIPKHFTIIDFGSGWNAQSYFFTSHKRYIAVNPISGVKEDDGMFKAPNCEIYRMTTGEFLSKVDYPNVNVFAICSYVPNWYGDNSIEMVKKTFQNCYTFFPIIL